MIEVQGINQLGILADRLKAVAARGVEQEISKGAGNALKTLPRTLAASALATLPRSGGLAGDVAQDILQNARRTSRRWGARVTVSSDYAIGRMDQGSLLHPLYGDKSHWFAQRVNPGFAKRPMQAIRPQAQREMSAALDRVAR